MRPQLLFFLFSPITRIKGIGSVTAKALARLLPPMTAQEGNAAPLVRDLLFHLPVSIVDRRFTCPLNQAPDGAVATFIVRVDAHQPPPARKRGAKPPYRVLCSNDTGDITLVFFHARDDYIKQSLPVGQERVISGRVEYFDYRLQMTHPDIIAPVSQLAEVQKPEPVYPLTVGLTSRRIGKIVGEALAQLPPLAEWIDASVMAAHRWPDFKAALVSAHHPQSMEDMLPTSPARARLAYDEMLANQLHLAMLRCAMRQQAGEVITGTGALTSALRRQLPFQLTAGQEQALKDIGGDMASGHRMGRLLQGDVGSGKTVVALLAMLQAAEQGLQSALMVPTELIAQQHYENIVASCQLLVAGNASNRQPTTSNPIILLTGNIKGVARKDALEKIANGEARIVIGTHALFQEHVEFKNLALAVVDEQHRFGVNQRLALSQKGHLPHILHMTATPIPRSLAMTLYGDMDSSLLTEKPAGRKPITTRVIPLSRYGEIMDRLQAALSRGEKAYWICPLIDEKTHHDDMELMLERDIAAANSRHTEFKARFGAQVGLVHGRMKAAERDEAMRDFASGKTRLLVATTVIEVGIDVKDATIIVIEQAERFGLSQLHQLRGRVGRSDLPSSCVLLASDHLGEEGKARLSILRETEDGFRIAEEDLAIRGSGDLLGTRQSGEQRFVFTDMHVHQPLLREAHEHAKRLLASDAFKSEPAQTLLQLFGYS